MSILLKLPYDILKPTLERMDKKTLLNMAIASRTLNELASWALYTSVTFNKRTRNEYQYTGNLENPFDAFERRPSPRDAVREVVLCTSFLYAYSSPTEGQFTSAERCYKEFARLQNVNVIYINASLNRNECEEYSRLISGLPKVGKIVLLSVRAAKVMAFGNIENIVLYHNPSLVRNRDLIKLTPRVSKVVSTSPNRFYYPRSQPNQLALLTSLQELILSPISRHSPNDICRLVENTKRLRRLSFVCDLTVPMREPSAGRLQPKQIVLSDLLPTGITTFTDLRIKFFSRKLPGEGTLLHATIRSLAGSSRLKRLDVVSSQDSPVILECRELLDHILSIHGPTLHTLKIPILRPTIPWIQRVFIRSQCLTELWLCIDKNTKDKLSEQLVSSACIEVLRLYGSGTWIFGFAQALIQQSSHTLRQVQAHEIPCRFKERKAIWTATWEYDEEEKRPVHSIHGPLEDEIPTTKWRSSRRSRQRQYTQSGTLESDDSDCDIHVRDEEISWVPITITGSQSPDWAAVGRDWLTEGDPTNEWGDSTGW